MSYFNREPLNPSLKSLLRNTQPLDGCARFGEKHKEGMYQNCTAVGRLAQTKLSLCRRRIRKQDVDKGSREVTTVQKQTQEIRSIDCPRIEENSIDL